MKMMSQMTSEGQWRLDLQIFNQHVQKPIDIGSQRYISYGSRVVIQKPGGVESLRFVLMI